MNPQLRRVETFELDGKTYSLTFPPIKETRKVQDLLHRITPLIASLEKHGADNLFALACNGGISADELQQLTDLFAPNCTVDVGQDRVLLMKKDETQNELWSDAIELQYEWLDKCLKTVFAGLLGKSRAVIAVVAESAKKAMAAKAEQE